MIIVLLAKNLDSLQTVVNVVHSSLSDINLSLEAPKSKFTVFNPKAGVSECLLVGPFSVASTNTLSYSQAIKKNIRKTYGMLTKMKGQFDKNCPERLYNVVLSPHIFLLCRFRSFLVRLNLL